MSEGSKEFFANSPYPGFYSANRRIACEPLESLALETQSRSGFQVVKQKTSLFKTRVVFGNERFMASTWVYVRGDVVTAPWAKEVFEVGARKFILVPEDAVQLVELEEPEAQGG